MSEQNHIERVKQGDREAFAFLVDRYKAPAFSIAWKILRNSADAEEVVQEAFIKVYHAIHQFRGEGKFSTWLYRIVYNACISQVRKNRNSCTPLDDVPEDRAGFYQLDDVLKQISDKQVKVLIQEALDELDETDFTILTLYYYEDKPLKEIARVLNIRYSNAKVKIQRARHRLYEVMKKALKTEMHDLL